MGIIQISLKTLSRKWKLQDLPLKILLLLFTINIFFTWIPSTYASTNQTLGEKLKDGVNEVAHLSPIALTLIIAPIVGLFVIGLTIYCVCCKVRKMKQRRTSTFSGITVLKAPPGQPAPIPLTGMVNQPRGGFPKLTATPNNRNGYCESSSLV